MDTPLVWSIEGAREVQALPYVDREYEDPKMRETVQRLIREEMAKMPKKDYLEGLPLPDTEFSSPLVALEMDRIDSGLPAVKLDTTRYEPMVPKGAAASRERSWQKSVENCATQLQHARTKVDNLELAVKYGPAAWAASNTNLETAGNILENASKKRRQEIDAVNKSRHADQTEAGGKLGTLKRKYASLTTKVLDVQGACILLEMENEGLREQCKARGIEPATPDENADQTIEAVHGD